MTALGGLVAGILVGSIPTADWLGRRWGFDLRSQGSGNPGANNAFRLGGPFLGTTVLAVEAAKGLAAVWLGHALAGSAGAALGGMGATTANVYNPWYRLRGGKGLAITAGTVAAAWPPLAMVLAVVIGTGMAIVRRSGPAALVTLGTYLSVSAAALVTSLPGRWAVGDPDWMAIMAAAQVLTLLPKHYLDTIRPSDRPGSRAGS